MRQRLFRHHGYRWWFAVVAITVLGCGTSPTTPTASPFTGHWVGTYIVRHCVPVGWSSCAAAEQENQLYQMDLVLMQTGTSVSGSLTIDAGVPPTPMNVTGTASQNALTLTGTWIDPFINRVYSDRLRLTGWATNRDASGRLQGTFGFVYETTWGIARMKPVGETWTLTYDAELVNVVLQP
jgi:hypothetical protein